MGCELDRKRKSASDSGSGKINKKIKSVKSSSRASNVDSELQKKMWNAVISGDDNSFIDDNRIDPEDRYESDYSEKPVRVSVKAKEFDEEVENLFKGFGRRKKNLEKSAAELCLFIESHMAEFELAAESDAELNLNNQPAIYKLSKLPLLVDLLSKKHLQLELLDRGVLTLLKNWLEPLPDGSLPNITIRTGVLNILTDFRMDLEEFQRREQLKTSGLGKVIMFLSRSDEETPGNRKLAKDLVDKWSRPIFNKSNRFEDTRRYSDDDKLLNRRPVVKMITDKAVTQDCRDIDLDEFIRETRSGVLSSWQRVSKPEAAPMDFMVRPQSKIDPDEIRARAKLIVHDQRRVKIHKKLKQLKAPKKKRLQASMLSAEGRNMVKLF